MLKRVMRLLREEFPDFLSPLYYYQLFLRLRIQRFCIGYSGRRHWSFWSHLLKTRKPRKLLILGVYFGRDIAFLLELQKQYQTSLAITGVDKFEDKFCDDWPEETRKKSWAEAGFGPAPSIQAAMDNLRRLGHSLNGVQLVRARAEDFLRSTTDFYDFIYIDTAHDYESTVELIGLAVARLAPGGRMGGDDYSDQGTWGVARAVKACFAKHYLFKTNSQIWYAEPQDWLAPKQA